MIIRRKITIESSLYTMLLMHGMGHADNLCGGVLLSLLNWNIENRHKIYGEKYLTEIIDSLFNEQKQKARSLYWEKGLKVAPRVNPG